MTSQERQEYLDLKGFEQQKVGCNLISIALMDMGQKSYGHLGTMFSSTLQKPTILGCVPELTALSKTSPGGKLNRMKHI